METTKTADRAAAQNIYVPEIAELVRVEKMTALETLFEVRLPGGRDLGHQPGQFVQVSLFGIGEAPISISSSPSRSNGKFELCVRRVGDVTGALHGMEAGATIGVRGPFGSGFPITEKLVFLLIEPAERERPTRRHPEFWYIQCTGRDCLPMLRGSAHGWDAGSYPKAPWL